jgi:hypothetical protein
VRQLVNGIVKSSPVSSTYSITTMLLGSVVRIRKFKSLGPA